MCACVMCVCVRVCVCVSLTVGALNATCACVRVAHHLEDKITVVVRCAMLLCNKWNDSGSLTLVD